MRGTYHSRFYADFISRRAQREWRASVARWKFIRSMHFSDLRLQMFYQTTTMSGDRVRNSRLITWEPNWVRVSRFVRRRFLEIYSAVRTKNSRWSENSRRQRNVNFRDEATDRPFGNRAIATTTRSDVWKLIATARMLYNDWEQRERAIDRWIARSERPDDDYEQKKNKEKEKKNFEPLGKRFSA